MDSIPHEVSFVMSSCSKVYAMSTLRGRSSRVVALKEIKFYSGVTNFNTATPRHLVSYDEIIIIID